MELTIITFDDGAKINYLYTADGTKHQKRVTAKGKTSVTDYLSGYIYEDGKFKQFATAEGHVEERGGKPLYVYDYKDQTNNVRLMYADINKTGSPMILQERNYYPFGLEHKGYNETVAGTLNRYRNYQGQELNTELGLNWLSFKYRNYDPAMGRFLSIDPLAEKYSYQSPYNFSENQVIDGLELEGLEKVSIHIRSFAPYDSFGNMLIAGPFEGDGSNRGFTTNLSASSRISGLIDLDLSGNGITKLGQKGIGAISQDLTTGNKTYSEGFLDVSFGKRKIADGTMAATDLGFHLYGNNDAFPFKASPDIDVKGVLGIGVIDYKNGSSSAFLSGKILGDRFPANETFLTDAKGKSVFLGVSGVKGKVFKLLGEHSRKMSSFSLQINFNPDGNINNVNYNGQDYSIEDWNKQFKDLDPTNENVSTNFSW